MANIFLQYRLIFTTYLFSILLFTGCQCGLPEQSVATEQGRLILFENRQLLDHVGLWVTLEGSVSQSKMSQIIGVDIDANYENQDLRGRFAQASGILETWSVTQEELNASYAEYGIFANRGPGQFFRLIQPGSLKQLALAIPLDVSNH